MSESSRAAGTAQELREGDVFRFSYSEDSWNRARSGFGHGDLHWCFDGQLIYRDGKLCDTYWGLTGGGGNGRYFTLAEAQAQGTLTSVCNLNDVEKIPEHDFNLYADGEAFNLSHQHGCYKHFVKRRGARKDPELMKQAVHRGIQAARDEVDRAIRNLDRLVDRRDGLIRRIEAGEEPNV